MFTPSYIHTSRNSETSALRARTEHKRAGSAATAHQTSHWPRKQVTMTSTYVTNCAHGPAHRDTRTCGAGSQSLHVQQPAQRNRSELVDLAWERPRPRRTRKPEVRPDKTAARRACGAAKHSIVHRMARQGTPTSKNCLSIRASVTPSALEVALAITRVESPPVLIERSQSVSAPRTRRGESSSDSTMSRPYGR